MGWTTPVDSYCERLGPGLWAEPLNASTNLAFALAAWVMWRRTEAMPYGRALCAVLFAIAIGSGLFHTVAERWAGLADVVPILVFILVFLWAVNREVWRMGRAAAVLATVLFIPYAAGAAALIGRAAPWIGTSAGYVPVVLLIAGYAAALAPRARAFARDLSIGACVLALSIAARALDMPLCPVWPLGTHFLWHLLNALMLGWMIEALRRQMLAAPGGRR